MGYLRTLAGALSLASGLAFSSITPAQSQTGIVGCEDHWSSSLTALSFGENLGQIRQFYNGRVTVIQTDTEEPAAASFGAVILMPDGDGTDEPLGIACYLTWGYGYVDVANTQSSYDPVEGLTLSIPTQAYDPETSLMETGNPIRVRLNLSEGTAVELD